MKFYESTVLNNLDFFRELRNKNNNDVCDTKLMRHGIDMFLYWKTVEYFKPKKILEIGVFLGQTLGLFAEASEQADIIGIDIDISRYSLNELIDTSNIKILEQDSRELDVGNELFDLVHIDGGHSYELCSNDIKKVMPLLHNKSILILDDTVMSGVDQAVKELLSEYHDWVPFMQADQGTWFHHCSHSADDFLDYYIQEKSNNFIDFRNINYYNFTVLRASMPNIFNVNDQIYIDALKFYQL